jgi:hypothetical protein
MSIEESREMSEKIVIRPEEIAKTIPTQAESGLLRSKDAWFVGAAIAAVLSVVVVGIVLVVSFSTSDEPISGGGHLSRQSSATLAYWDQLRQIGDGLDDENAFTETDSAEQYAAQLQQQRKAIDGATEEITRLATLDVDQDAIEVGTKMAEFLSESDALLASLERLVKDGEALGARATSAELMVESFVRGFFGDPFGTTYEMRAEQGKLSDRHQRILGQAELLQSRANELRIFGSRMRAKLTTRYGIEFPPLE